MLLVYNALKILELNGTISFTEHSLFRSRIRCVVSNTTLYDFQIRNRNLDPVISMLSRTHAGIFEDFVNLDESGLVKSLKIDNNPLRKMLLDLEKNGIYEINWASNKPQITLLNERLMDSHLYLKPEVLSKRKEVALQKFKEVINYLTLDKCRSQQLLAYFGQEGEPCGICDVCKASKKDLKEQKNQSIEELVLDFLYEPRSLIEIKLHVAQADDQKVRNILFEMLDNHKIKFDGLKYFRKSS